MSAESAPPVAPPPRRSLFRRLLRWLMLLCLAVFLGLVVVSIPAFKVAAGWWQEGVELADDHANFKVSHPGWSFPARIVTQPTSLFIHPKKLIVEAKARGYREDCKKTDPGEYCGKTGQVVPRGGQELEPIELGWLIGPDGEVRFYLPLKEAPKQLIEAILAAEDRNFYQHMGVNIVAMARAVLANAQERTYVQGGSTLTMQLVRNLSQRREKTFERKLREMVMAMALDHHLGKDRVLEMYLNAPYLGQRGGLSICGFAAAARHYYGKDVQELTLGETATLAGILPAPGKFAPDRAPEQARQRRNMVLQAMKEAFGYDITAAQKEPIKVGPPLSLPERYPAYLSATRAWLEEKLSPKALYGAGMKVTVGMDIFMQEVAEELFPAKTRYFENLVGRHGEGPLQAAAVLLDVETGLIRVVYGGSDVTSVSFNRATQARRQAGSAIKPLVYALAFSEPPGPDGKPRFTAATAEPNSPRVFKTPQGDWRPRNISGEYSTTACLAQGLAWSQNIATASLLEDLGGPRKLIALASRMGFDTRKFPEEMGLALGQGEVTPLEMAQFAAIVANDGYQITGSPVLKAVDAAGQVRVEAPKAGERVLSPEAATLTRELMRLVVDLGTGGKARGGAGDAGYPGEVLGKTGTTDREKDLWFVGATPLYAAALWLGYDTPAKVHASASDFASPLWGWWIHRTTLYDDPLPKFNREVKLVRRDVCIETGKVPNETCRVIPAPFLPGTSPHSVCPEEHPPPPTPDPTLDGEDVDAARAAQSPPDGYESIWDRIQRAREEEEARQNGEKPLENPPANPPVNPLPPP